jgi:hypothetical protein
MVPGLAFAPQNATAQKTLSLQAGVSLGSQWAFSEEPQSASYRIGLRAGLSTVLQASPMVGMQLGLAYVQKGGTESPLAGIDHTLRIDYLEVPLLLRLAIPSSRASPQFVLGPTVSFATSCSSTRRGGSTALYYGTDPASLDCESEGVGSVDFGATGGLGLDLRTSRRATITADVLYYVGFRSAGVFSKLKAWSLLLGVGLPF